MQVKVEDMEFHMQVEDVKSHYYANAYIASPARDPRCEQALKQWVLE